MVFKMCIIWNAITASLLRVLVLLFAFFLSDSDVTGFVNRQWIEGVDANRNAMIATINASIAEVKHNTNTLLRSVNNLGRQNHDSLCATHQKTTAQALSRLTKRLESIDKQNDDNTKKMTDVCSDMETLREELSRLRGEVDGLRARPTGATREGGDASGEPALSGEVIKQTSNASYLSPDVWAVEAGAEKRLVASEMPAQDGIFTVLLIDTSESMLHDNAWHEVKTFVDDLITGLDTMKREQDCTEEYISLITFGGQTKCHVKYTNDFQACKTGFDKVTIGGPSPFTGGLCRVLAIAGVPTDHCFHLCENEIFVPVRTVIVTDGYPTHHLQHRGSDEMKTDIDDESKEQILRITERLPADTGAEVIFVPVGRANMRFINELCDVCNGRVFGFRDGLTLSRRTYLAKKILPDRRNRFDRMGLFYNPLFASGLNKDARLPDHGTGLSSVDRTQMRELIERSEHEEEQRRKQREVYQELDDPQLPIPGSRVRRGPDWSSGDEDGHGVGTVIGHAKDYLGCQVNVIWDGDKTMYRYAFGHADKYEVIPTDEPRFLFPGQPVDSGCIVTIGKDYKGERKQDEKGVVLRAGIRDGRHVAIVRWQDGEREICSNGEDKVFEIRKCDAHEIASWSKQKESTVQRKSGVDASLGPTVGMDEIRKNKNKNA